MSAAVPDLEALAEPTVTAALIIDIPSQTARRNPVRTTPSHSAACDAMQPYRHAHLVITVVTSIRRIIPC